MASTRQDTSALPARDARKLMKSPGIRRISMELPDRFKVDDDEKDGAENAEDKPALVQQSVYGMIAAAGQSRAQIRPQFRVDSGSDSEDGAEQESSPSRQKQASSKSTGQVSGREPSLDEAPKPNASRPESSRHRKNKLSENKLLRSFLKPIRERSDSRSDPMAQSQFLPPREATADQTERPASASGIRTDAPNMDRKLQAMARAGVEASSTSASGRRSGSGSMGEGPSDKTAPVLLPVALAEIFRFDEPEEVISEYPCWYLQAVLLQGYMYITKKHICFYAYLQKKSHVVVKSGHLAKQGKRNPRYQRYWFVLKGDILSYYTSAADPYFPNGTIDLRYGISADLAAEKDRETTAFTVTTDTRTYHFKADSATSAKEWVKQLQKVIFRSHNDGDSVKISLPISNVIDVEANPVVDFAETVKVRVIDNDETYAVDEYFFTFFGFGKDALNLLTILTEDNDAKRAAVEAGRTVKSSLKERTTPAIRRSVSSEQRKRLSVDTAPPVPEPVRSTLSPLVTSRRASPRASGEQFRSSPDASRTSFDRGRASFDRGRRSFSATRSLQRAQTEPRSPLSPSAQESTESFVTTSEHVPSSPATPGVDMSASQMLGGDGAFRAPTLRMPPPRRTVSGSTVERLRRESQQSSPVRSSTEEHARVQSPGDTQSGQSSGKTDRDADEQGMQVTSSAGSKPKRALATPLQHAFTFAGHVRSQSKRGLSYLNASPKDYYNKFSGALVGGKKHYSEADGLAPEDRIVDPEDELSTAEHERRFQQHFALPESERLFAVYYCWLHRVLPLYGKVYIGSRNFCFRSLLYGTRTKLVVPFKHIDNLEKEKGFRWGYPGMVVIIRGHEELFFDFSSPALRDDCVVTVLRSLDTIRAVQESMLMTDGEKQDAEAAAAENELLQEARKDGYAEHDLKLPQNVDQSEPRAPPILFDDPNASVLDFKPEQSMRITCLTIGSRGDVQPYIALCKGFLADGHKPTIATHHEFEGWILSLIHI